MIYYSKNKAPLKVFLSRIQDDEHHLLFSERNNYEAYQYFRQNAPLHWDRHKDWCRKQAYDDSLSMFRVHSYSGKKKDEYGLDRHFAASIGTVGLTSIDHVNSRAEFSIVIDGEFQGYGLGRDALISILGHGFLDLNLNRIFGEVFEINPALSKFMDIGFELEGKRREFYYRNGRYVDAYLVSISRAKFLSLYSLERISSFAGDLKPVEAASGKAGGGYPGPYKPAS